MTNLFENATIAHVSGRPHSHQAALEILSPEGFTTAMEEITQWDGYAPTPLYSLKALAESLYLNEVLRHSAELMQLYVYYKNKSLSF